MRSRRDAEVVEDRWHARMDEAYELPSLSVKALPGPSPDPS
jgi:hypothetical protein